MRDTACPRAATPVAPALGGTTIRIFFLVGFMAAPSGDAMPAGGDRVGESRQADDARDAEPEDRGARGAAHPRRAAQPQEPLRGQARGEQVRKRAQAEG